MRELRSRKADIRGVVALCTILGLQVPGGGTHWITATDFDVATASGMS